jgi:predicted O-methyltransferase YrrM
MSLTKVIQLVKILPNHPIEVWDRLATVLEVKTDKKNVQSGDYCPIAWEDILGNLDRTVDPRCSTFAGEPALQAIGALVEDRQRSRSDQGPFSPNHDGDSLLGRLCYVVARATKPEFVIETGVAYGVTSAFILQALSVNETGRLHSIDLPPLANNADSHVGALVPPELRDRWQLHRGPSKRLLPSLLAELGAVNMFVHDSLHTYRTMYWELNIVTPFLQPASIVIADDVQDNRAFATWSASRPSRMSAVLKEHTKDSLLGISVGE